MNRRLIDIRKVLINKINVLNPLFKDSKIGFIKGENEYYILHSSEIPSSIVISSATAGLDRFILVDKEDTYYSLEF